jgi:hypothetical protein
MATSGERKTVYMGELCKMGPFKVKVLSEPQKSKFKKGDGPDSFYIELEVGGRTRHYQPENEKCMEFFRGQMGNEFTLVAEGSREEARFVYAGQQGTPAAANRPRPHQQTQPPAPRPANQPPPEQQRTAPAPVVRPAQGQDPDPMVAAKKFIGRNATLARMALFKLGRLQSQYEEEYGEPMDFALRVAVYNTLVFGATGSGIMNNLPVDFQMPVNPTFQPAGPN